MAEGDKKERKHCSIWLRVAAVGLFVCCTAVAALVAFTYNVKCGNGPECVYSKSAASSDGGPCAEITMDILNAGGTAADGAIAGMLCSGVVNPQSMSIAGGFLLTYYNRSEQQAYTLNAREIAPGAATQDMFEGNKTLSRRGGLAVAVPGQLRGYKALYDRFGGGVAWADLFDPAIKLCKGYPISKSLAKAIRSRKEEILAEPTLRMFVNKDTEEVLQEDEMLKLPRMAETLRRLQLVPDSIYTGSLAYEIVRDLKKFDSIITLKDLKNYKAEWSDTIRVSLASQNSTLYSVPPPGSGAVIAFILNVLDEYNLDESSLNPTNVVLTYQRITEAFKYAYALRTYLGDPNFEDMTSLLANMTSDDYAKSIRMKIMENGTSQDPQYYGAYYEIVEDYGTSHISVISADGDAVAATSTLNTAFGALIASARTGIIFNNQMDDFSSPNITNVFGVPPSPANFIKPGKRPVSSMCPAILVSDSGDVSLVIGAIGGTRISSAVAQVTVLNSMCHLSLADSIAAPRMHHQLVPMSLMVERDFSQDLLRKLSELGHDIAMYPSVSVVNAVSRTSNGELHAVADHRKFGGTDGN